MDELLAQLGDDDDPTLWTTALEHILALFHGQARAAFIEVGRCSKWLRPHQRRWTAGGGFAYPSGYGKLPQFDWSLTLEQVGTGWGVVRRRKGMKIALRITIPARTRRHRSAVVHTLWRTRRGEEKRLMFGFRRTDGLWQCTAGPEEMTMV